MQQIAEKERRKEAILSSLAKLDYLSRGQLQRLHRLGSDRNAQRVLAGMGEYLSWFRHHQNVYYLNQAGRERIGCQRIRKKTMQVDHYLMRNDLYIHLGQPATWRNEVKLEIKGLVTIFTDALYMNGGRYHFVEVDHMQKMSKNRGKIECYKRLIRQAEIKHWPMLVWMTTTEHRRKQLIRLCDGLNARVYTIEDLR